MLDIFLIIWLQMSNILTSQVGLYHKLLYKSFSLLLTPPREHSSHTSPNETTYASVPSRTVFCDPQEGAPVCIGQCAFTKRPVSAAIRKSPFETSIPSDTLRPFI